MRIFIMPDTAKAVLTAFARYHTMSSSGKERCAEMNIQYKKGVLELCVLALLETRDQYGYDVSETLSARIDISDGTVYPILRKLKAEGLVTTYLSEESGGPPRKYYTLTELGRERYKSDKRDWLQFVEDVKILLEDHQNE